MSLEASSPSNRAEIHFWLRLKMNGSAKRGHEHFKGMKRSRAQSFGRGKEIADCRVRKERSSGWTGSTSLAGRSWEGLRIGTWSKGEVTEMRKGQNGMHVEGMKRSRAQSFGRGKEIADCRVQRGRSSDWTGSTSLAGRSWEGLRIGTWSKGEVIDMQ